jgi:molybdopterin biosynthesis enzyme MoaB
VAGSRHRTLIVNLPGSPGGVRDALHALVPIVDHAVSIVRGDRTDH